MLRRIRSGYLSFQIGTYVKPFLEPHTQLAALVAFTQKDHVQSQVEQVLHEFVLDFLSRHTRVIGELYSDDRLSKFGFKLLSIIIKTVTVVMKVLAVIMIILAVATIILLNTAIVASAVIAVFKILSYHQL